jgi:hypothetical protein
MEYLTAMEFLGFYSPQGGNSDDKIRLYKIWVSHRDDYILLECDTV